MYHFCPSIGFYLLAIPSLTSTQVYTIVMINPHSEFSLSHSLVNPDELGFNIFLSLNFLQKIMMINLPGPHLCPLYPIAKAGRIFSPAGFKAESWPCMPRQVTSSPNTHFF